MLSKLLALGTLLLTLFAFVKGDHSVCGWTGPGAGDPAKYGFKQYCMSFRVDVVESGDDPDHPSSVKYLCSGWRVADWNVLRSGVLELRTPCNDGGFVKAAGGDCGIANWGYCLTNSSDMTSPSCFYLTAFNDCEWPGTFTLDTLPLKVAIYNK